MPDVIVVQSGASTLAFSVVDASTDPMVITQFILRRDAYVASLRLAASFMAPRALFAPDAGPQTPPTQATRLKTVGELIALGQDHIAKGEAAALDRLREGLRQIRRGEVALDVGGGFFGLASIGGVAIASAHASFDLAGSLPTDTFEPPPAGLPALRLTASARADVALGFGQARASLEVALDVASFDLGCDFSFDLPDLPALPPLGLRLPRFTLPHLQFESVALPDLAGFLTLRLPTTGLGVTVDGAPGARLVVTGGALTLTTNKVSGTLTLDGKQFATFTDVALTLQPGSAPLVGTVNAGAPPAALDMAPRRLLDAGPFTVDLLSGDSTLSPNGSFDLENGRGPLDLGVTTKALIMLKAVEDPTLSITLDATYGLDAVRGGGRLIKFSVVAPYSLPLVTDTATQALDGALRALALIPMPGVVAGGPDTRALLRHVARFLGVCARWFSKSAGGALAGVGEGAVKLIERLLDALVDAGADAASHVAIEARLDAKSLALRQIVLTPVISGAGGAPITLGGPALRLSATMAWRPSLLFDVSGAPLVALCVGADPGAKLTLSTDLWLESESAGQQAATPIDGPPTSGPPPPPVADPLIQVSATQAKACVIALVTIDGGRLSFLRKLDDATGATEPLAGGPGASILLLRGRPSLATIGSGDVTITGAINGAQAKRLLPFLSGGSAAAAPGVPGLPQSIEILPPGDATYPIANGEIGFPLGVRLHVLDTAIEAKIELTLDIATLRARIKGGDTLDIMGKSEPTPFLGMSMQVLSKQSVAPDASFAQWRLDFSHGDVSFRLHPGAYVEFTYARIASKGRGLVFHADVFAVTRDGVSITADLQTDAPVQLAGVEQAFQFTSGQLVVERGVLRTFAIAGAGQLPPTLVGEATAKIALTLAQRDGALVVQSADAELEMPGKPLVCKATCFTIEVQKLGLEMEDFGAQGVHFYFQVTGSARFTPDGDAFSKGMLRYLPDLTITLEKAPLTTDARLLKDRVRFQVAVVPPRRIKLFEVFEFELRGFGFRPSSPAFGGKPAISISGQISFLEAGDAISPSIDFHELWIAPPKDGASLPQIRCDGLGVVVGLGGAGSIEATAVAVDGSLPSLPAPLVREGEKAPFTARGFLARGRIAITGLAPLSAAMGFLELTDAASGDVRHAFFVYGQANRLAERVPLPFFEIWLREAGFGFGYGYTLAALAAADKVTTPAQLVQVLDPLTKMSGELANFEAWHPDSVGGRLTLAMRVMFSMACVSQSQQLSDKEKDLPNPVLFDATLALRSDLTLLMTVRAWLSVNYWRWDHAAATDELRKRPSLSGYLYLSAPRKILLARLRNNRDGIIGDTPPMHPALKKMFEAIDWSATLYVAPGIYHQEIGWPNQLSFEIRDGNDQFYVRCEGGTILRIEDGAVLQGIAFNAKGYAQLGGAIGGSSLGACVFARADFEVGGKFITYFSLRDVADSFYYGALGFTITLRFIVRVWLEFSVGLFDVHLEAGFSVSLCVTVALELVASPRGLGGRGRAQLSVCAFGRTLSLSAGFAFGDDALDRARVAVDRFMTLGLGAVAPDPEQGLASPPLVTSPAKAVEHADTQAQAAMERHEQMNPPPAGAGQAAVDPVKPPRFWALLRPLKADDRIYIMTLIPRDATGDAAGARHDVNDGAKNDGAKDDAFGGFYAPPGAADEAHYEIVGANGGPPPPDLLRLDLSGKPQKVTAPIVAAYDGPVAVNGATTLPLAHLLRECFVVDKTTKEVAGQPRHRPMCVGVTPLAGDRAEADAQLRRASAMMAVASDDMKRDQAIEQRRSSVIAAVHDSIRDLAERIVSIDDEAPKREAPVAGRQVIDARDFGLTFLVTHTQLDTLFDDHTPRRAIFSVKTRCASGAAFSDPAPVDLFNPPERFFDHMSPILRRAACAIGADAVALDWDLEPGWATPTGADAAKSPYDEPEFHLLHYRISGVARCDPGRVFALQNAPVTVRAAAPLDLDANGAFQPLRPRAQFTDRLDLAALAPLRAAIFANDWSKLKDTTQVSFEYLIVPVDIAGREGAPRLLVGVRKRPAEKLTPIRRVEAIFDYGAMPTPGSTFGWPGDDGGPPPFALRLRVDDPPSWKKPAPGEPKPRADEKRLPDNGARYRLRLRRETPAGAGRYGADAVDEAIGRPAPADFSDARGADRNFVVTMKNANAEVIGADGAKLETGEARFLFWPVLDAAAQARRPWKLAPYFLLEGATLADLTDALGVGAPGAEPRAIRVGLRRLTKDAPPRPDPASRNADPDPALSPWAVADLSLRIAPDAGGSEVETAIEVFEHPLAFSFDPLHFDDLYGESGRTQVLHPHPGARLSDWIDAPSAARTGLVAKAGKPPPGAFLRDRERRIGTRIVWNARPMLPSGGKNDDPFARPGYLGGFDVFAIDLLAQGAIRPSADDARRIARAQVLPDRMKAIDPAEIENYAALESFYPSQSARLCQWPDNGDHVKERSDGIAPWFSTAESLLDWPEWGPRRALGLDVEEVALSPLFSAGLPKQFTLSIVAAGGRTAPQLALWRRADPAAPPAIAARSNAAGVLTVNVADGEQAATRLRRALFELGLTGVGPDDETALAGASLSITRVGCAEPPVTIALSSSTRLHPFLADLVERLRWDDDKPGKLSRRFSVVLDGAPPTDAKTFADLMNERPAPRDPYGWAVLRTLGLAVGVRLYDMQTGDYCKPCELRMRLDTALSDILARYEGARLGAPFVDLMVRSDGLIRLQSLDGRTLPRVRLEEQYDDQALAMAQVALRPAPEALSQDAAATGAAHYVRVLAASGATLTLDMNRAALVALGAGAAVIEAVDLSGAAAAPHPVTLAGDDPGSKALCPTGAPEAASLDVTMPAGRTPPALALMLRVTVLPKKGAAAPAPVDLVKAALGDVAGLAVEEIVAPLAAQAPDETVPTAEPFGVFAELTDATVKALLFGVPSPPAAAGAVAVDPLAAPNAAALKRFARFACIAQRFEAKATLEALIDPYLRLAPRLIEHGPGRKVPPGAVAVSLTAFIRPDPWRLPISGGRIGALFLHDDRYARRHRYVVRPFGRYEHLAAAASGAADGAGDVNAARLKDVGDDAFALHGVDIVISRTHPVETPPIVLAHAYDPTSNGAESAPSRVLEWIMARRGETADAAANSFVAARLGGAFVASGLFHGFAGRRFAAGLPGALVADDAFGPGVAPDRLPLSIHEDRIDDALAPDGCRLTQVAPDGWRGVEAQRLRDIPHGLALYGVTYAAAGVVVSTPVATAFPAPRYRLAFPWTQGAPSPLPAPEWTVEPDTRAIVIETALVRYLDGVEAQARTEWGLDHASPPQNFLFPDDAVVYALRLARRGVAPDKASADGPTIVSTQVEWRPVAAATGGPSQSFYEASAPGRRLHGKSAVVSRVDQGPWTLRLSVVAKADSTTMTIARPAGDTPADWTAFRDEIGRVQGLLEAPFKDLLTPYLTIRDTAGWNDAAGGGPLKRIATPPFHAGVKVFGANAPGACGSAFVTLPEADGYDWTSPVAAEQAPDVNSLWRAALAPLPQDATGIADALRALAADAAAPNVFSVLLGAQVNWKPAKAEQIVALFADLDGKSGLNGLNRRGAAQARESLALTLEAGNEGHVEIFLPHRIVPVLTAALVGWGSVKNSVPLGLILHAPPTADELAALSALDSDLGAFAQEAALDQLFGAHMRPLLSAFHGEESAVHHPLGAPQ